MDEVRRQSKKLVDHFNLDKQQPGVGDPPIFWTTKVEVSKLEQGQHILAKDGFPRTTISPDDLVTWSDLLGCQFAKGPKAADRKVTPKGWKDSLVLLYEILLCHYGLNSQRTSSVEEFYPTPGKQQQMKRSRGAPERLREAPERLREAPETLREAPLNSAPKPRKAKKANSDVAQMFNFAAISSEEEEVFTQDKRRRLGLDSKSKGSDVISSNPECGEVVPVLRDWGKYNLFDSLSDFSFGCRLMILKCSSEEMKLMLSDSEFSIEASLSQRCRNYIPFLKPGSIVKILITFGGIHDLTIVSIVGMII